MLWQRLTEDFAKRFDAGEFTPGGKFLTVKDICAQHNVSNMTARRVVTELAKANYIESAPGRGSIVKAQPGLKQIFLATDFSSRTSSITMEIFDGVVKECARANIELEYVGYGELKNIHDDGKAGYIISGNRIKHLDYCQRQYGDKYKRMVSYDDLKPCKFIPSCTLNLEKAARIAVEYLIGKGHERIAIMGTKGQHWHQSRIESYKRVLEEHGINYDDDLFKPFAVSHEYSLECEQGVRALIQLESKPSAIFCISGIYALKLVNVCRKLKVKIPGDLAVIAIDNYAEMNFVRPRITTVDTHFSRMGAECVKMLIEQAEAPDKRISHRVIEPHLIVRDSV